MHDPIDTKEHDMNERIVEELAIQTLSAFRQMLVDRITEDVEHEVEHNYSPPYGWDDHYADNKELIREWVYGEVYDRLTYKLNEL